MQRIDPKDLGRIEGDEQQGVYVGVKEWPDGDVTLEIFLANSTISEHNGKLLPRVSIPVHYVPNVIRMLAEALAYALNDGDEDDDEDAA